MNTQTNLTNEQIKATVFEILASIAPEAEFEALKPNDNIQEVFDIDSFDFLNFLIGLNESLGVDIPESDYPKLATLEGILNYLALHLT